MKTKHFLLTIFAIVGLAFSVSAHEGCNKKTSADSTAIKKECIKTGKSCCKDKNACCEACTCKDKCTCKDSKTCCCNKDGKTCTCKEGACCKGTTKAKTTKQAK